MSFISKPLVLILAIILFQPLPDAGAETENFDNSAALASIDADIAARQATLAEGKQLHTELSDKMPSIRQAAQAMLDAEMKLADLENTSRTSYQNNALKVQMKLGVAIALVTPAALSPARNLLDTAATGVSLLVADPLINEAFNWMGQGNPVEGKKKNLQSFADGTFPSQHRLEFWLAEAPTDDAGVLARERQIIKYAQAGILEVRRARLDMMSLYRETLDLLKSLEIRIMSLEREIETLIRHRAAAAGELVEQPPPEKLPALGLRPSASTAGDMYQAVSYVKIDEIIAQLTELRSVIYGKIELIGTTRQVLIEKISQLFQEGDQQRKNIEKKRNDTVKKLYEEHQDSASVQELGTSCGPQHVSYSQAISSAKKRYQGWVTIENTYIGQLESLRDHYQQAQSQLLELSEIGQLQQAYGDYIDLTNAHYAIQQEWHSQLRKRGFYKDISLPYKGILFDFIDEARNGLFSQGQQIGHELEKSQRFLDEVEESWPSTLDTLNKLAQNCIDQARFSLEMQLEQAKLSKQLLEDYFTAAHSLQRHYQQLISQDMLSPSTNNGIRYYPVSDKWISQQLENSPGVCEGTKKLTELLQPAADRLQLLQEAAQNADNLAFNSVSDLASNSIAEHNLPSLHNQLLSLAQTMTAVPAELQQAREIMGISSDLIWLTERLRENQTGIFIVSEDRPALHDLFNRQIKTILELTPMVRNLLVEVKAAQKRTRIGSTVASEYRQRYNKLLKRYSDDLECLGTDHNHTREIAAGLPELDTAIRSLSGKPTYLDGSASISNLTAFTTSVRNLPLGEDKAYRQQVTTLQSEYALHNTWYEKNKSALLPVESQQLTQLLDTASRYMEVHLTHLRNLDEIAATASDNTLLIDFYQSFRQAYERKNESLVMSHIHDDWSAAGGVTLFDLEDNLRNMYNVYDDIQYTLSGLRLDRVGPNLYNVSYNVTILGINYSNDFTHEEVSSVTEQVIIDSKGTPKIYKTLGGNYWSIQ